MTRSLRQSSPQGAACGFWIRAWGQREPADQGTGRLNSPARRLGLLKGGLDIPSNHAGCRSLRIKHPSRTLTRRVCSRAKRAATAMFAHITLPLFQRRHTWFISRSNKALATAPFPSGMVGRFLKPQIRAQHE